MVILDNHRLQSKIRMQDKLLFTLCLRGEKKVTRSGLYKCVFKYLKSKMSEFVCREKVEAILKYKVKVF